MLQDLEQKLCVEESCVKRDFWKLLLSLYHMAEFPTLQQITECYIFLGSINSRLIFAFLKVAWVANSVKHSERIPFFSTLAIMNLICIWILLILLL